MPLIVAGIAILALLGVYLMWKAYRRDQEEVWRIERKVGRRDLILRSDIETLMRVRSSLLVEAIELRRQQTEGHGHPESS